MDGIFNSPESEIQNFWKALCFERTEMILQDLSQPEYSGTVIAEGVYPDPGTIKAVTPKAPAVFLYAEEEFLRSCYYGRESTLWMEDIFSDCENPRETKMMWIDKWIAIDSSSKGDAADMGYPVMHAGAGTDWNIYEKRIAEALGINITKL